MCEFEYRQEELEKTPFDNLDNYNENDDVSKESSYQNEKLFNLFSKLIEIVNVIEKGIIIEEINNLLYDDIEELYEYIVNKSWKVSPEQFNFIIHTIFVLKENLIFRTIRDKLLYSVHKLIGNYPELVDFILTGGEVNDLMGIFSGIFFQNDRILLLKVISNSKENFKGISKEFLMNMFVGIDKSIEILRKPGNAENHEMNGLVFKYFICVFECIEYIATFYSSEEAIQNEIFDFSIRFLTKEYFEICPMFVYRVINCISSCICNFKSCDKFDFNSYLDFLIEILFGPDYQCRVYIFRLFAIISKQPFLYVWNLNTFGLIVENVFEWMKNKDTHDFIPYMSFFFDFVSNAICYEFELFEILNSIGFFEWSFNLYEKVPVKLKLHIINLFINLTNPKIWDKTVDFFIKFNIVSELFMSLNSDSYDELFQRNIIDCLIHIIDVNFEMLFDEQKTLIAQQFQSDVVDELLSTFDPENDVLDRMAKTLCKKVKSINES